MKLRVVSPRTTILTYLLIELFAITFFLLVWRNLSPYGVFSIMQVLQYGLLVIVGLFTLIPVALELIGFGSHRLSISEKGVSYRARKTRYRLGWEEIDHIALCPSLLGQTTKSSYVCFFADDRTRRVSGRAEFSRSAFGLQYRKGLPELIAKYCDLPIENLKEIQK